MFRYKKLGYVALDVTDVERSADHYEKMVGLEVVERTPNGPVFLRCSQDHHNLILYPAEEPGLKRVGWEVENPEQLELAFEHFTKAGLRPQEISKEEREQLGQGDSFRIQDPVVGVTFEFYSEIKQLAVPYRPTVTKIARLGHVVLNVREYEQMLKFLTEVMNFRVSDYIDHVFAFMRCFPNPYHHSFGIGKSERDNLQHINFMTTDIDDIGSAYQRMLKNNVPVVFGPGRHFPSTSIFLYFLDPDGMTVEFSFGMEEFPETNPRKPRLLDRSLEVLDTWGGRPDQRMGAVGKIKTN